MSDYETFIPENEFHIPEGYYDINEIAVLLKENKRKPRVIEFIAEMMEE